MMSKRYSDMKTNKFILLIGGCALLTTACTNNAKSSVAESHTSEQTLVSSEKNLDDTLQHGLDSRQTLQMLTEIDAVMADVSESASTAQQHINAAIMALQTIDGNSSQLAGIEHQLKEASRSLDDIHHALGEE